MSIAKNNLEILKENFNKHYKAKKAIDNAEKKIDRNTWVSISLYLFLYLEQLDKKKWNFFKGLRAMATKKEVDNINMTIIFTFCDNTKLKVWHDELGEFYAYKEVIE